jgi:hypothetical protein
LEGGEEGIKNNEPILSFSPIAVNAWTVPGSWGKHVASSSPVPVEFCRGHVETMKFAPSSVVRVVYFFFPPALGFELRTSCLLVEPLCQPSQGLFCSHVNLVLLLLS